MFAIGKVKLIYPGKRIKKVDLWSQDASAGEGHVRIRDICKIFDWGQIAYSDEDACQIQLCAHFDGPLKGFSTDMFRRDECVVVMGKRDTCTANRRGRESVEPPPPNYGVPLKEHGTFNDIFKLHQRIQGYMTDIDASLETISKVHVK